MALFDRRLLAYFDDGGFGSGTFHDRIVDYQQDLCEIERELFKYQHVLGIHRVRVKARDRRSWFAQHQQPLAVPDLPRVPALVDGPLPREPLLEHTHTVTQYRPGHEARVRDVRRKELADAAEPHLSESSLTEPAEKRRSGTGRLRADGGSAGGHVESRQSLTSESRRGSLSKEAPRKQREDVQEEPPAQPPPALQPSQAQAPKPSQPSQPPPAPQPSQPSQPSQPPQPPQPPQPTLLDTMSKLEPKQLSAHWAQVDTVFLAPQQEVKPQCKFTVKCRWLGKEKVAQTDTLKDVEANPNAAQPDPNFPQRCKVRQQLKLEGANEVRVVVIDVFQNEGEKAQLVGTVMLDACDNKNHASTVKEHLYLGDRKLESLLAVKLSLGLPTARPVEKPPVAVQDPAADGKQAQRNSQTSKTAVGGGGAGAVVPVAAPAALQTSPPSLPPSKPEAQNEEEDEEEDEEEIIIEEGEEEEPAEDDPEQEDVSPSGAR